jgi:Uma2 family endonuclease
VGPLLHERLHNVRSRGTKRACHAGSSEQQTPGSSRTDPARTRILVPPSLVIESVSPGHERHDRDVKRKWYAEFGVPHYWLLNAYERTLDCLVLQGGVYEVAQTVRDDAQVRPPPFPGLVIPLAHVWNA